MHQNLAMNGKSPHTVSQETSFDLNWPFKHNSTASEDLAYPFSDCAGWDL